MPKPKRLPAVEGSPLDRVITEALRIQSVPRIVLAPLLLAWAYLCSRFHGSDALVLWGFFLVDWAVLAASPRLGISYGPARPAVVLLALLRAPFALLPPPWWWLLQALGATLVVYGFWIEPSRLFLTRQALHTPKLRGTKPLRILQVGDLHVERTSVRERKLLARARELGPDLILFTGDLLSYSAVDDDRARADVRCVFSSFDPPLGIYAVAGSPPVDRPDVLADVFRGLPVTLLDRTKARVWYDGGTIDLFGLSCTHDPDLDTPALDTLEPEEDSFSILLHHSPDIAPAAAERGFDLQLSGHTHGGQVRLPLYGAILTSSVLSKRFEAGRYRVGDMTLYVSRGVGMEGKAAPRVRFLCPPEIVLWEIEGRGEDPP